MSPVDPVNPKSEDDLSSERPRLHDIAFRMLGSSLEAERAVDQTVARWRRAQKADPHAIAARRDLLTEILARTCVDILRQARDGHDRYLGGWLPEPIPHPRAETRQILADPVDRISLDESLNMLLLVVLESLTPEQRVAFILHDVFGVPFWGIADVVGRSPDDARELARSARRQIQQRRKHEVPQEHHRSIVMELLGGCTARAEDRVRAILHPDITVLIDNGGRVNSAPSPVRGVDEAARLLIGVVTGVPGMTVSEQSVNGQTGLVFRQASRVVGVLSVNIKADNIVDTWIVLNPDKLRAWNTD
ncbi:RNA polymerase subunit sigma-24 [Lacisediminihabitans profunda]|uniref:RNA polymerase subunit sigma-24 n=1 Tax=Lacisediminihabitans profunda TaxID=2594790 RepID=A0A5C8UKJ1_9MICO|nr:RNA polymerase subunit sigma-24 [Lacisediminihabitans profunda]TXN28327.1 RNA polymerase subunit sigma-24 [Lacisediminihabitans profunda]